MTEEWRLLIDGPAPGAWNMAVDEAIFRAVEASPGPPRAGRWDHGPLSCFARPDLVEYVTPGSGTRYYLVVPSAGTSEGTFGSSSNGSLRPPSDLACRPRDATSCS